MIKLGFKPLLAALGTAVMTLPLVLGLFAGQPVHAGDEAPAEPTSTTVILTKVKSAAEPSQADLTEDQKLTADDVLANVGFTVYDISQQYWATDATTDKDQATLAADMNKTVNEPQRVGDFTTKAVGEPQKTGTDGKITYTLSNYATVKLDGQDVQRPAVYLFVEDVNDAASQGFGVAANFVLSLPLDSGADTAYVYPKDKQNETLHLRFRKVDEANRDVALKGAAFRIKNAAGQYAHVADPTALDTAQHITWVAQADASTFTSSEKGEFGLTGWADTDKLGVGLTQDDRYTIEEVTAPAGYNKDAAIVDATDLTVTPQDEAYQVTDSPEGLLPHTGGAGIIAFVVLGAALVALGSVAYAKRRQIN